NLSLRSAQAAGQAKGLRRQTHRSSSDFCLPLPCTTTTFSPPSASNGDLLEECFFLADSPCSWSRVSLSLFSLAINWDSYWLSESRHLFSRTSSKTWE